MDWKVQQVNLKEPESPLFQGALGLDEFLFGRGHARSLPLEINRKYQPTLFVASKGEQVCGFKLGYERKPNHYYSWMGGVDPEFRGQGIAKALMVAQHEWLQSQGYQAIRTHCKNQWMDMLMLNLKFGFQVIGTFTDDEGETKIILEKFFTEKPESSFFI